MASILKLYHAKPDRNAYDVTAFEK